MKLLVMLAAIYALIINQSLKQKDKNISLKTDSGSEQQPVKRTNNVFYNTASGREASALSMPVPNRNYKNTNPLPALYKEHPFRPREKSVDNGLQDFLSPVNFSYIPGTEKEGSR